MLMAVAMSLGSIAFAEDKAPDREGFAPDENPNVNPPPGAVQDPGGQRPPPPTFEQWVEGGKKIPQGLVFTGGSPFFNESNGKRREDEDAYKIIFGIPGTPRPGTGGPDPRPEVERPDPRVEEYRKLEQWLEGHKAEAAKLERDLEVKIAEANKNPDKNEVEHHVKDLVARHDAAMAGHAEERKNLESRMAELIKIPEVVICIFPPRPEPRPFPRHWGRPPAIQTKDLRPLPEGFEGMGSSTLCAWIERNVKSDLANKDKPKPEPKRPPVVRPPEPPRPELSDDAKAELTGIKSEKKALMEEMKAKLATLEKDASREDTRKAVEEFKKDNEARFAAVKEAADKVHEELKAKRPERKERTEPPPSVKVKIAEVKKVEKTLDVARKTVRDELKKAEDDLEAKIAGAKENADKEKVEKWLEGHKAEAGKAERDLEVKIAELRKNPDEREVAIAVKEARARHDANMAGHAVERKNLESRLAVLKAEVAINIKSLVAEQAAAKKAALDEFRAAQKEKHEELKAAKKELREEVRNTKEVGESRTSR